MNIFSGIEEDVLQEKLQETMEGINDFFTKSQDDSSSNDDNETPNMPNFPNMPDIDSMKDHLSSLFNGKIGSIFREKDQTKQVSAGLECGITLKDFADYQKKDIIEVYNSTVTERTI